MLEQNESSGQATLPLPPDLFDRAKTGSRISAKYRPKVELMASHVPAECFYVRFGQWQNQVWLTRLQREFEGDLGRMAILRGIEPNSAKRIEEQLCLEQDPLAETFGQTMISDFGVIGSDLYVNEGPALGVLFEERNGLLTSQLKSARAKSSRAKKKTARHRLS